jgi:hypothetical protein
MKINLDFIESHLRSLFEESLVRVLPGEHTQFNLIDKLLAVINQNLKETGEGTMIAPDRFVIAIPQNELSNWQQHQDLLEKILVELNTFGTSNGINFPSQPTIHLETLPEGVECRIDIRCAFSPAAPALPDTAAMDHPQDELTPPDVPQNAFLVIGGKTNFPLIGPVINIGRHSENDLVLDDQYVSRHHAQIRAINKRYVVFDVGSTGGIFINGKQIAQATLHPGDVISMGIINLIYVQDSTSENPTSAVQIENDDKPFGDPHS